jgi:hypothetical protein
MIKYSTSPLTLQGTDDLIRRLREEARYSVIKKKKWGQDRNVNGELVDFYLVYVNR